MNSEQRERLTQVRLKADRTWRKLNKDMQKELTAVTKKASAAKKKIHAAYQKRRDNLYQVVENVRESIRLERLAAKAAIIDASEEVPAPDGYLWYSQGGKHHLVEEYAQIAYYDNGSDDGIEFWPCLCRGWMIGRSEFRTQSVRAFHACKTCLRKMDQEQNDAE